MRTSERLLLIPQDRQVEVNRSYSRPGVRWYGSCQCLRLWDDIQRHALWFRLFPIPPIPLLDVAKYDYEPAQSSIIRCAPCPYERVR